MPRSIIASTSTQGVEFEIISATDIASAPDKKGWYSWHYIPSDINSVSLSLFRSFKSFAQVHDLFGLTLEGSISPKKKFITSKFNQDDQDTARALLMLYSTPLYIGISKNLLSRLRTHKRQLDEFMQNSARNIQGENIANVESDTDEESTCFASRLAPFLLDSGVNVSDLYIRIIQDKGNADLKAIEKILNHTTLPRFGRR